MVLILTGGGEYRGIGLVEVIWKAVAAILNCRFTAAITYHDFLHRFREDRMEDRLSQGRNLLKQLELEGGGSCTATFPESV